MEVFISQKGNLTELISWKYYSPLMFPKNNKSRYELPLARVIKIVRNCNTDYLEIQIRLKQLPSTKRGLLRCTSSWVETLGIVRTLAEKFRLEYRNFTLTFPLNLIFHFHISLWCLRGHYMAAFSPFQAGGGFVGYGWRLWLVLRSWDWG